MKQTVLEIVCVATEDDVINEYVNWVKCERKQFLDSLAGLSKDEIRRASDLFYKTTLEHHRFRMRGAAIDRSNINEKVKLGIELSQVNVESGEISAMRSINDIQERLRKSSISQNLSVEMFNMTRPIFRDIQTIIAFFTEV